MLVLEGTTGKKMPENQREGSDSKGARSTGTMRVATFIVALLASRSISCDPESQYPTSPTAVSVRSGRDRASSASSPAALSGKTTAGEARLNARHGMSECHLPSCGPRETASPATAMSDYAQDPKELWDYEGNVPLGTTVFVRIMGRDSQPRKIPVRISPDEDALYFDGHCFRLVVMTRIGEFDAQIRQVTIEQGKATIKAGLQVPVFGYVTGSAVWDVAMTQEYTEQLADGTKDVKFPVQIPILGERSARIVPARRVSVSAP